MQAIRELRERTHLGMSECKLALDEAQGDVEKAVEILQKKGSLKKADPLLVPREGIVRAMVVDGVGKIAELNCQTDFAAKSELFSTYLNKILTSPEKTGLSLDQLMEEGKLLSKQLGEKTVLKRYDFLPTGVYSGITQSVCSAYSHHSGKIAVLVTANVEIEHAGNQKIASFLDDVAMQIAANKPLGLDRNAIAVMAAAEKQAELFKDQVKDKPAPMQEKIIKGKLDKWMQEIVLLEQESILQAKTTVTKMMEAVQKEVGSKFELANFIRYELGE